MLVTPTFHCLNTLLQPLKAHQQIIHQCFQLSVVHSLQRRPDGYRSSLVPAHDACSGLSQSLTRPVLPAARVATGSVMLDRRGCAHPAMTEDVRIGWSKVSADVTQGEPHVGSGGEAINAGRGACLDEEPARSGLRSQRIVLGSFTGTPTMGIASGNGCWPLHRSR